MWIVMIVILLFNFTSIGTIFLSIYLNHSFGISVQNIAFIVSMYGFGWVISSLAISFIKGILKNYRINSLLFCIKLLSYVVLTSTHSLINLTIVMLFIGVADGILIVTMRMQLMSLVNPENRHIVYSVSRVFGNIGSSISLIIAGYLADTHFNISLYISSLASLIAILIILLKNKSLYSNTIAVVNTHQTKRYDHLQLYIFFIIIVLFVNFPYAQRTNTYTLFLSNILHYSTREIGIFLSYAIVFSIIFEVPIVNQLKGISKLFLSVFGCLMTLIGFGILYFLKFHNHMWIIFLSSTIWSIGMILYLSSGFTWLVDVFGNKPNSNIFIGLYQLMPAISVLCFPLVGGYFYNIDPFLIWVICLVSSIFLLALGLVFRNHFKYEVCMVTPPKNNVILK